MHEQNYAGAANPFQLLQLGPQAGQVAGLDFVGAPLLNQNILRQLAPAAQHMAAQSQSSNKAAALQQLAMANYVPSVRLGCGDITTKVQPGALGTFSPEGSVPLRLTQYHVASSIAPFFAITSIVVARVNLMAGSQPVPAEDFIPNARNAPLEFPLAAAGSQVIVSAVNIDTAPHYFMSSFAAIDLTTSAARMIPRASAARGRPRA